MKNTIKILAVSLLGVGSITPITFKTQVEQLAYDDEESGYKISLEHEIIKQDKDDYDMVANIQGIIKYYNYQAPLQASLEYEFHTINATNTFLKSIVLLLNNYIKEDYQIVPVPKKFGSTTAEQLFLQTAVSYALKNKFPILTLSNGYLPGWSKKKTNGFFSTIYGIDNIEITRPDIGVYEIVDTIKNNDNSQVFIRGTEWTDFFSQVGYFFMPTKKFNFSERTINVKAEVKDSFWNDEVDESIDSIVINQKVNLWQNAGIFNFSLFKTLVKELNLVNSYFFYLWDEWAFIGLLQKWDPSEMGAETKWDYNYDTSINWVKEDDSMLDIDGYTRNTYDQRTLELFNRFDIAARKSDTGEFINPYMGVSMGDIWEIKCI